MRSACPVSPKAVVFPHSQYAHELKFDRDVVTNTFYRGGNWFANLAKNGLVLAYKLTDTGGDTSYA